jgi:hypothetical protein
MQASNRAISRRSERLLFLREKSDDHQHEHFGDHAEDQVQSQLLSLKASDRILAQSLFLVRQGILAVAEYPFAIVQNREFLRWKSPFHSPPDIVVLLRARLDFLTYFSAGHYLGSDNGV